MSLCSLFWYFCLSRQQEWVTWELLWIIPSISVTGPGSEHCLHQHLSREKVWGMIQKWLHCRILYEQLSEKYVRLLNPIHNFTEYYILKANISNYFSLKWKKSTFFDMKFSRKFIYWSQAMIPSGFETCFCFWTGFPYPRILQNLSKQNTIQHDKDQNWPTLDVTRA